MPPASPPRACARILRGYPTLVGWIGRYALLVLLLGGGVLMGSLLGPVLYALLN